MSWSKTIAALLLAVALTGCGFEPMYGPRGSGKSAEAALATVRVAQISERYGQVMTNMLRDDFNPGIRTEPALYQLDVALSELRSNLAVRNDGTATREDLTLSANFTLRRLSDNVPVLRGIAKNQNGHDVLENEYTNFVNDQRDEQRAIVDVVDQIRDRVALYLTSH